MSQRDDPCDMALLKAIVENPEVELDAERAMRAQNEFSRGVEEAMEARVLESEIPAFGDVDWDTVNDIYLAGARDGAGLITEEKFGLNKLVAAAFDNAGYQNFKQMRVALMLSNPSTHLKNVFATGGQGTIVRPLEEAIAVLISKRRGPEAQQMREMFHYSTGGARAVHDSISGMATLAKMGAKKGAFAAEEIKSMLREQGYPEELAMQSKQALVDTGGDLADVTSGRFITKAGKYLMNAAYGSQFSALSAEDIMWKMASHRAKVQQLLSRKGAREGITGKLELDRYVSEHWDEMSDAVKSGRELPSDLKTIQDTGVAQAAEDTFTEIPHTKLGKLMAGTGFDTNVGFTRVFSETMQIIAPFRPIFVNLMRQAFTRRLAAPLNMPQRFIRWANFDEKTAAELAGKMGPEMQDLAYGRIAGAYTLLAGTMGLITTGAMKIHSADNVDPAIRDLQFATEGKVGNTLQIEDWYFPIDMLPPGIAMMLAWTAGMKEGLDDVMNFRYAADDTVIDQAMAGLGPFMTAVTDGPWVKEYLDFLNRTNSYIQYGNVGGLSQYLASLVLSPMKPPRWAQGVFGVSPDVKVTDGAVSQILTDWGDWREMYGYRRNMAGNRITPPMRMGRNLDKPYFGMGDEVVGFLDKIDYDQVYPTTWAKKASDEALAGKLGLPGNAADVKLPPQAIDRLEKYVGQSRLMSGMTLEEEIKAFLKSNQVYNKDGSLRIAKPTLQNHILKLQADRRAVARKLVTYNPAFGIRQKQIDGLYKAFLKANPGKEREAEMIRRDLINKMNMTAQKLQSKKAF